MHWKVRDIAAKALSWAEQNEDSVSRSAATFLRNIILYCLMSVPSFLLSQTGLRLCIFHMC